MYKSISRRKFVRLGSAAAAVPFSQWWAEHAQAQQPFKRASAHSAAGKQALLSYRKAVAEMEQISQTDPKNPIGWMFQYKIHQFPDQFDSLRSNPTQLAAARNTELDSIFGAGTPQRALAARILGTCHASAIAGGDEFWPWHRMYVFFFERICRKLSGDPAFALPYWNYHDPNARTLPEEFRIPIGKAANKLWHSRREELNNGSPIPANRLNFGYLLQDDFFASQNQIDQDPHGAVHVYAGTEAGRPDTYDMRWVGRSPKDPIFWLHHCEIDRAWEFWLSRNSRTNPSDAPWLENRNDPERGFIFIDENGKDVLLTNGEVLKTTQIKGLLGYVYDPPPPPSPSMMSSTARRVIASAPTVSVGERRRDVSVQANAQTMALAERSQMAIGTRRVHVRVGDVEVKAGEPPANIGLYLNLPDNADPQQADQHLVAVISTFGLPHAEGHHGGSKRPDLVFDATQVAQRLADAGRWESGLKFSTVPLDGQPKDDNIVLKDVRVEVVNTAGAF